MNAHAFGSTPAIRAAIRAAESLCALPAVPTQDWCERAAKAMLPLHPPSIVMVMFAKLAESGAVQRVETAGVAGCTLTEVSTTFGRTHSVSTMTPMNATHPAIGAVRAAAHGCADLGWSPLAPSNNGSTVAAAAQRTGIAAGSPLLARWGETGATGLIYGAAPLMQGGESGRYVIVEIGLTGAADAAAGPGEQESALLANTLPLLSRRAAIAFGASPFTEGSCLTHREEVVLSHLLYGKSVREIAGELGRSPHTVHDHVKSLHRKLNATSRGALVARALGHVPPKAAEPGHATHAPASGTMVITIPAETRDILTSR